MIKNLTLYMLLLLSVPIVTWLVNYEWAGGQIHFIDTPLLYISELIETPKTQYICIVLTLWLMWLTRKHHSWVVVGLICTVSIISMHLIKEKNKNFFMEPRPYVQYLLKEDVEPFYRELGEPERVRIIQSHIRQGEYAKYDQHRAENIGFSFPSGHTIFTDTWLFIFAGFLYGIRNKSAVSAVSLLLVFTLLMAVSRIRLGMHFPIDIAASTLISYLFHIVAFTAVVPLLSKWKLLNHKLFAPPPEK